MEPIEDTQHPRNRHIYLLPNLLTTCGLFSGFYAILAAASGHFDHACLAVFVAGVFDGVDGRVARLTGTSSEFGVQYDSLADLVSFGMAPALVMYHWALVGMKADGPLAAKLGWGAAFLYVACAALRLARFNTQVGVVDKRWFIGLNSPSSAAVMMAFVWSMNEFGFSGENLRYAATALTIACGLLMVSRIRYTSFKGDRKNERVPFWVMLLIVLFLVALLIDAPRVLLVVASAYALSGPLYLLWNKAGRKSSP
ncbi:MAG: CDP-diacylglycerol--serine O-phosphatidyltransferase [Arenimonas sp.]|nr:CDP-diacylglycerol--serine O-phosphatidyltransferase [Arenimonas sp.]